MPHTLLVFSALRRARAGCRPWGKPKPDGAGLFCTLGCMALVSLLLAAPLPVRAQVTLLVPSEPSVEAPPLKAGKAEVDKGEAGKVEAAKNEAKAEVAPREDKKGKEQKGTPPENMPAASLPPPRPPTPPSPPRLPQPRQRHSRTLAQKWTCLSPCCAPSAMRAWSWTCPSFSPCCVMTMPRR